MEPKQTVKNSKPKGGVSRTSSVFLIALVIVFVFGITGGVIADRLFEFKPLDVFLLSDQDEQGMELTKERIVTEESAVVRVAEEVSPSVVTVTIQTPERRIIEYNPFGGGFVPRLEGGQVRDIGSGFVISKDGLIVTNKHVVSSDATYKVVTQDDKEYEVVKISKDPNNDIAILKVEANDLIPVTLGDSDGLKVGQFVVAIGTALGEFRHTVTTGVISGLGRGITAGNPYEGFVEEIDNVIQTDAAINPGNSGGPLLNSSGKVIGVNVAVAQGAENVGFAIPINVVKKGLEEFNSTGSFPGKPFLGVQYQVIDQRTAVLNELPQGAYIIDVIPDSPADIAGVKPDDIMMKINGQEMGDDESALADLISGLKVGDSVKLEVWRVLPAQAGDETLSLTATLKNFEE